MDGAEQPVVAPRHGPLARAVHQALLEDEAGGVLRRMLLQLFPEADAVQCAPHHLHERPYSTQIDKTSAQIAKSDRCCRLRTPANVSISSTE